ncbi:PDZ domain-containing protein [Falsiroseomonas sp. CW058]|uniref:PDZ domain-containing protein n=1 Tax=Falsiroseomonas sp. CW058 TaxID=3388664 RepID=UPI003D321D46
MRAAQRDWLRQRNACTTVDCVANAFAQRIAQLRDGGRGARPWFGVNIRDVPADATRPPGLPPEVGGALVTAAAPGGPAAAAGIQPGDVVLRIAEQEVREAVALPRIVSGLQPGSTVPVVVWRGARAQTLHVAVGEAPAQQQAAPAQAAPPAPGLDHQRAASAAEAQRREAERREADSRAAEARRLAEIERLRRDAEFRAASERQRLDQLVGGGWLVGEVVCTQPVNREEERRMRLRAELSLGGGAGERDRTATLRLAERLVNSEDLARFAAVELRGTVAGGGDARDVVLWPTGWAMDRDPRIDMAIGSSPQAVAPRGTLHLSGLPEFRGTLFAGALPNGFTCAATTLRQEAGITRWESQHGQVERGIATLLQALPDLRGGGDDDLVLYARRMGGAHARMRLDGTVAFPGGASNLCLLAPFAPDAPFRDWVQQQAGAVTSTRPSLSCADDAFDLLGLRRHALWALSPGNLAWLAQWAGGLERVAVLTQADHAQSVARERAAQAQHEAELRDAEARRLAAEREAAGRLAARRAEAARRIVAAGEEPTLFVIHTGRPTRDACVLGATETQAATRGAIATGLARDEAARGAEAMAAQIQSARRLPDAEAIFAEVQSGRCAFLLGTARELAPLVTALPRLGRDSLQVLGLAVEAEAAARIAEAEAERDRARREAEARAARERQEAEAAAEARRRRALVEAAGTYELRPTDGTGRPVAPALYRVHDGRLYIPIEAAGGGSPADRARAVRLSGSPRAWLTQGSIQLAPGVTRLEDGTTVTTDAIAIDGYDICTRSVADTFARPVNNSVWVNTTVVCFSPHRREMFLEAELLIWLDQDGLRLFRDQCEPGAARRQGYCIARGLSGLDRGARPAQWRGPRVPDGS